MVPSAFSASTAAGYVGFLSTLITRGIGLPDASIALRRKRLAAAVSRFGREQKVDRLPCGIQRSIQILVLAFYAYIGLVDPIALVRRLEMRSTAFVQLGCICLHPAPNAAGIHLDTTFGHQLGDVLVGERIPEIPAHAQNDHISRVMAPFETGCGLIGMDFYPIRMPAPKFRDGTFVPSVAPV